jgi:hypothetical protein
MTSRTFVFPANWIESHKVLSGPFKEFVKAMNVAGHTVIATLTGESQTRDQQEKYHGMIGDISEQAKHLGSKWEEEDWKRLLLDKFARETGRTGGRIIPNLDGSGVVEVGVQSRKFGKKDANEFIEFLYAWASENGCYLTEKVTDPATGVVHIVTWQMARARDEVAA